MSEIYLPNVLNASNADVVGTPVSCLGLTQVFFEVVVNVTGATLSATITFGMGVEQPPNFPAGFPPANNGGAVALASGLSYNGSNGILTITNPAIGRTSTTIRFATPPRYVVPTYQYGGGGGTVSVRCSAWGWGQGTYP